MNKAIQYREDGKFYGLINVPEQLDFKKLSKDKIFGDYKFFTGYKNSEIQEQYNTELKACVESGKEIINPEVLKFALGVEKAWEIFDKRLIKPGDIFACPDNIEFEEDQFCAYHNLNCSYCGTCAGSCYKPKKVIRLKLKDEVKPVESQDELWSKVINATDDAMRTPQEFEKCRQYLKSKFTIQRNKNV